MAGNADDVNYEKLAQAIYQDILRREGNVTINVEHDVALAGRSTVMHQVDVFWRFRQAGVEHSVLIECKNYASAITLEKVRNLFAVLHDVGNCQGIMVTKTGYQSGVETFAKFYGIKLMLLRKPTEKDWEGKVKDIVIQMTTKFPVTDVASPPHVTMSFQFKNEEQKTRLEALQSKNCLHIKSVPDVRFRASTGDPVTEELRWWLPKQLQMSDKEPGGPYEQVISLQDHYILVNENTPNEELVQVKEVKIIYHVASEEREIKILGADIVDAILKDNDTGTVEYVKYNR